MPLQIVRNDITKMDVDAIVNAANPALRMGGGVCGEIFAAAGARELQEECDRIGYCPVGDAVATRGYGLKARHIIHTVGPTWQGGDRGEDEALRSCYAASLALAQRLRCASIAFPLVSSGIYGYPKDRALRIAVSAIGEYLAGHEMQVYLVVFDRSSFQISERLFSSIEQFIDENYVDEQMQHSLQRRLGYKEALRSESMSMPVPSAAPQSLQAPRKRSLEDVVNQLEESFSSRLLRLIDERGLTDVQVYKKANLDRKLFSKIRSAKGYNPGKRTALALAIALELNWDETIDLLAKAGWAMSRSNKFDVILEYFIAEGVYDIHEINEALFAFDQELLGG